MQRACGRIRDGHDTRICSGSVWSGARDQTCGGPLGPYAQSGRMDRYRAAWEQLRTGNFIYPCTCSRKDIRSAAITAPHAADDRGAGLPGHLPQPGGGDRRGGDRSNWRFRVPDGETVVNLWITILAANVRRGQGFRRFCGLAGRRCAGLSTGRSSWTMPQCESPRWCAGRICW